MWLLITYFVHAQSSDDDDSLGENNLEPRLFKPE